MEESDDGDDGQRRGANTRRGTSVCQRLGLIRDSDASWRNTRSSLTWEALRRSWVYHPLDQWSGTASRRGWHENPLQWSELRTIRCPWSADEFLYFIFTCLVNIFIAGYCDQHGEPATERSSPKSEESRGNRRVDQQKPKTQIKTTKNNEVNYCKMCRNGCRISRRIWWIRMFNHINTLPALLMNYQWSREQKWYRVRVSIVSFLTFRKTEIVTSGWGRKLKGLLAEDALVQSCPKRNILVTW